MTDNSEYDKLLADVREKARFAHDAVRVLEDDLARMRIKASEFDALLFRLRPRCAACHDVLDDPSIEHAECYGTIKAPTERDVGSPDHTSLTAQQADDLDEHEDDLVRAARAQQDVYYVRHQETDPLSINCGHPVFVGDACDICHTPFTHEDKDKIASYKPWIDGKFWHLKCRPDLDTDKCRVCKAAIAGPSGCCPDCDLDTQLPEIPRDAP